MNNHITTTRETTTPTPNTMIEINAHTTTSELPKYLNPKFEFNNNRNFCRLLNANPSSVEDLNRDVKKVLTSLYPQARAPICLAHQQTTIITSLAAIGDDIAKYSRIASAYVDRNRSRRYGISSDSKTPFLYHGCIVCERPRFVVFRDPNGDIDDQASAILRLARRASLVLVTQGGSRLEGWFSVVGWTKKDVRQIQSDAVGMGSHGNRSTGLKTYNIPGCGRAFQTIYFDPDAIGTRPR